MRIINDQFFDDDDVAAALSWLTTCAFRKLELPALAVVLAGQDHGELVRHLEEECRQIDRESDHLLILSMGSQDMRTRSKKFNSLWNCICAGIERVSRGVGRFPFHDTYWGTFSGAALRLLDLEPCCLPAVYLRFTGVRDGVGDSKAVVVPLPNARPELASRFLKELSWAASDHAAGLKMLDEFLRNRDLFGWVISDSTQSALDRILGEAFEAHPPRFGRQTRRGRGISHTMFLSGFKEATQNQGGDIAQTCNPQCFEEERVNMVFQSTVYPRFSSSHPELNDVIRAAKKFFSTPSRSATDFFRPDLAVALDLAVVAQDVGDFATPVRNIAAAMESIFTASLLHLVRGSKNIRLPAHLDHVDPEAGPVALSGVLLNHPRKVTIGVGGGLHPWLAPTLGAGIQVFEHWFSECVPSQVERSSCAEITRLLIEIARLRNPAAHGEFTGRDAAEEAWRVFETFLISGHASLMSRIRASFMEWPQIDWDTFGHIRKSPRPRYERALHDYRDADQTKISASKEAKREIESVRDQINRARGAKGQMADYLLGSAPSLSGFQNLTSAVRREAGTDLLCTLTGWTEAIERLESATESDRLAKNLRRSAARWFEPLRREDSAYLAEFSRALIPTQRALGGPEQFDKIVERLDSLLALGKIRAREAHWKELVITNLNAWSESAIRSARAKNWLDSICPMDAALGGDAPIVAIVSGWIGDLELVIGQLEALVSEAEEKRAEASRIFECAESRLTAARIGDECVCFCGRHSTT